MATYMTAVYQPDKLIAAEGNFNNGNTGWNLFTIPDQAQQRNYVHPGLLLLDEPTEGLDHHTARALLENLRSALPGTTIIAAIHDRTLDHLPVPADATVRLAAGRVLPVT